MVTVLRISNTIETNYCKQVIEAISGYKAVKPCLLWAVWEIHSCPMQLEPLEAWFILYMYVVAALVHYIMHHA